MKAVLISLALLTGASAVQAQLPFRPEVRPFAGILIPTGEQRTQYVDEPMYGVQAALEVRPTFHVVGTFAWTPARTSYATAQDKVNVLMYNVGVEFGVVEQLTGAWELRPFVGGGLGGRSYAFQATSLTDRTCFGAYVAMGTEVQLHRTAFRIEARDNGYCYKSPVAGAGSKTRNDIGVSFGLAYHLR